MAQQTASFQEVDSITWQQYLSEDWKGLLKTTKEATHDGVDYCYLRMRSAWAYYNLKKYRLASHEYEKALDFNSGDPLTQQLILTNYVLGGRDLDALFYSENLDYRNNSDLYRKYRNPLKSFSFFLTLSDANSSSVINSMNSMVYPTENGVQKVSRYFLLPQLGLSHSLSSNHWIASHQIGLLARNEYSLWIDDPTTLSTPEQWIYQFNYSGSVAYTPFRGLHITPAVYFSWLSIPVYEDIQVGYGGRYSRVRTSTFTDTNLFGALRVDKDFSYFALGLSGAYGSVNFGQNMQAGLHATLYPLANLNLYLITAGYWQQKTASGMSTTELMGNMKLGSKITNYLWLEGSTLLGNVNGFLDHDDGIFYNGLEINKNIYGAAAILFIPNSKAQVRLSYQFTNVASPFYPQSNPLEYSNIQKYSNHNFTIGMIWKY